uniref:Uncharacterized protein n=1 Tax=Rangifer tarandus platyrhynchus TaxID=3082113 RepID=A0ACB0EXQ6_RANTA|nr:unnamed protein product [Rangifer tarandus platyrhynchus]
MAGCLGLAAGADGPRGPWVAVPGQPDGDVGLAPSGDLSGPVKWKVRRGPAQCEFALETSLSAAMCSGGMTVCPAARTRRDLEAGLHMERARGPSSSLRNGQEKLPVQSGGLSSPFCCWTVPPREELWAVEAPGAGIQLCRLLPYTGQTERLA